MISPDATEEQVQKAKRIGKSFVDPQASSR
jgi:hypothetical protein